MVNLIRYVLVLQPKDKGSKDIKNVEYGQTRNVGKDMIMPTEH